jgi:predicted alpha-1,6-mannanase (GH76 family)
MLRAYDVTKDTSWKNAVETVWANIQTGWNDTMGGGIAWQKQELYYKNTPANGPACILAGRLYEHFGNASDLAWAQKIYNWWQSTLVDPGSGFVYDGINQNDDGQLNTTYRFTYNQGLFIGAAAEMYNATGQASYISNAIQTANNVLTDHDQRRPGRRRPLQRRARSLYDPAHPEQRHRRRRPAEIRRVPEK